MDIVVLFATLSLAVYTDLRWRKVQNFLTFGAMGAGIFLQVVMRGWDGGRNSIIGLVIGFILLFPFFILRGVGAGDLKLMAAIGAIMGYIFVLSVFGYTMILFAGFCAAFLLYRRMSVVKPKQLSLPLAVLIAAGAMGTILFPFWSF